MRGACAGLTQRGHPWAKAALGPALSGRGASASARAECTTLASQATMPLGLGALCSNGLCELQPLAFPTGSHVYSRVHTHENAPPEAAAYGVDSGSPHTRTGRPRSQAGPLGELICPILLLNPVISCRTGCLVEVGRLLSGKRGRLLLRHMSLNCILLS